MASTPRKVLPLISNAVVLALKSANSAHQCVPGSAVLLAALHKLRYPEAYPLSLKVRVANQKWQQWEKVHGVPADDDRCVELRESGAYEYRIESDAGVKWSGHLAVVVPNYYYGNHALMDLTVVQANTPKEGIVLQPLLLQVTDGFVNGQEPHIEMINECRLTYAAFPEDQHFRTDTNFERIPREVIEQGVNIALRLL